MDLEKIDDRIMVKITRVKAPFEFGPVEIFIGFLVDVEGNFIRCPQVGEPIYLNGEDNDGLPWLFRSDVIYGLNTYDNQWEVLTEQGVQYTIEHHRVYL